MVVNIQDSSQTPSHALDRSPRDAESLAGRAGLEIAETMALLLRLEWSGVAVAHPGSRWSRRGD